MAILITCGSQPRPGPTSGSAGLVRVHVADGRKCATDIRRPAGPARPSIVEPTFNSVEELAAHHTQSLAVSYPAGFKVLSCQETSDYSCSFTIDSVAWARRANSTNFGLQTNAFAWSGKLVPTARS